jgi:hypothetical protein
LLRNFPKLRISKKVKGMKVHLDTDLGGDMDDLCALATLLRWRGDVQLAGVTTVAEAKGRRAGYALGYHQFPARPFGLRVCRGVE